MAAEGPIPNDPIEACNAVRNGSLQYAMYSYRPESDTIAVRETELHDPNVPDEVAWERFLDRLKNDECRYIVYDFVYVGIQDGEKVTKRKLLFILWAPDGAHVREKMNLSSHGDRYREALGHFDDVLQGTIKKWISYPEVVKRLKRAAK